MSFFYNMITKAHKYLTLSTFLFCFVRSLRFLFQNHTFLKPDKIYFLLFFDHQNKKHTNILLFYTIFLPDHKEEFFFFFLCLYFFKISLFFKNFQNFTLFSSFLKTGQLKVFTLIGTLTF